ncbi:MAG TPA: hypothetical protein VER04_04735 [Polyangiaceae bacterium]|nr:hypothetical protein [Polyangiaceae bacterium]
MRHPLRSRLLSVLLHRLLPFTWLAACACSRHTEQSLSDVREPFIALERNFQGFKDWARVELADRPEQGNTHLAGETYEYLNAAPQAGAKAFPVGTIFVKTVESKKKSDIFAMVKRGKGFNGSGAAGWEWFGLRARADGSVAIVWRGVNAPDGESYGGDPLGGCNGCHGAAAKNDHVHAFSLARR